MDDKRNPLSFQLDVSDFLPAEESEKQSLVVMRESVNFWKDGFRRLKKNKVAMISLVVIILIMIFAFVLPSFYPYSYEQQIRGSENLGLLQYSEDELARRAAGEKFSAFSRNRQFRPGYYNKNYDGKQDIPSCRPYSKCDYTNYWFDLWSYLRLFRRKNRYDNDAYC